MSCGKLNYKYAVYEHEIAEENPNVLDLGIAQLKHSKTNQLQVDNMPLISSDMLIARESIIRAKTC
jgi:hypothetical protein